MKIGVTGHRHRPNIDWKWVRSAIVEQLRALPGPVVGCTSLAAGADQVFADVVLDLGGSLDVVIPFPEYDETFDKRADLNRFRKQLARAASITVLKTRATREDGYLRAGHEVVDRSEALLAIWDGKPAAGRGGTAEVVAYARAAGKRVMHVDTELKRVVVLG